MAGKIKPKKYDWKDSNLALFGSDIEKKVKQVSASTERAWEKAGQRPGLQIWRIVKFKVVHWPKEDYGSFFSGDSYIILHTYKKQKSEELLYNLHFWIGKYSTQDEYGAAAYKTVELDIFLGDKPVQHREVQQHESDLFKSYFDTITIMKGGAETGFRHVEPVKYETRLLSFRRVDSEIVDASGRKKIKKNIVIKEVPCFRESLDSDDVFVVDAGLHLYQWNGKDANKDERYHGMQYVRTLRANRSNKPRVETLDEARLNASHSIFKHLPTGGVSKEKRDKHPDPEGEKKLFKVSDNGGDLKMTIVSTGTVSKDDLKSEDAFVLDVGNRVYVWIGSNASEDEKKNAVPMAHNYLSTTDHPFVPATMIQENKGECKDFDACFD